MLRIALIITLLIASQVAAQTNYEKGMHRAFALWEDNKVEDATNVFERIASAESNNWLPAYYAAEVLILDGFKTKDFTAMDAQMNRAQRFLNAATAISKDNPEVLVMQALLHTVYVANDGATYGRLLSGKIAALYAKAYGIAPENPRVLLNKTEWAMGSARFFGQDTAPFCKDIEKALELFTNFQPETEFHPKWGKERAVQILKSCK